MHEMLTIVTGVCGVSPSVCLSHGFTVWGSFGAAFAKSLWPLVYIHANAFAPYKVARMAVTIQSASEKTPNTKIAAISQKRVNILALNIPCLFTREILHVCLILLQLLIARHTDA